MTWFDEALHGEILDAGFTQRLQISTIVYRGRTKFQDVLIFDTPHFGRVLALDGIVQTTERDEFAYHEMLVHVPVISHGYVRSVLIVGGGDGGCLRETLRHQSVETACMVELDAEVVSLCREHLPGLSVGAFDDPRTELVIGDGCAFVRETDVRFDVIIVDSTDPIGQGEVLFSEEFYKNCKRCLTPGGILVTQSGVPVMQPEELSECSKLLAKVFADTTAYLIAVPTYIGGYMALSWASDNPSLRQYSREVLQSRYRLSGPACKYYSPAVHQAAFELPPFISALLDMK